MSSSSDVPSVARDLQPGELTRNPSLEQQGELTAEGRRWHALQRSFSNLAAHLFYETYPDQRPLDFKLEDVFENGFVFLPSTHTRDGEIGMERPKVQGGDYRPHYPQRSADAYMNVQKAEIASLRQEIDQAEKHHQITNDYSGDKELRKLLDLCDNALAETDSKEKT